MEARVLFLFLVVGLVNAQDVSENEIYDDIDEGKCGPCDKDSCPEIKKCAAGLVPDTCGCCMVCGKLEGEACESAKLKLPYKHKYGFCGSQLECKMREPQLDGESDAGCSCKTQELVCGSNGKTYKNYCLLSEATFEDESVEFSDWGPCRTKPEITSPPNNETQALGRNLQLGCESQGFPVPVMHWEFTNEDGVVTTLPSDNMRIAIQTRGGPEAYMVTCWVQILKIEPRNAGWYSCVAGNEVGKTTAGASVGVYREEQD